MSIAAVACRAQFGLHAPLVQVEVSIASGLPAFNIVGLPATAVRESKDRVRAAVLHSNFEFPSGRITVNLSPADFPKHGGRFDLPIAIGILLASRQLKLAADTQARPAGPAGPAGPELYGELGLGGEMKRVSGMLLAAAHAARDRTEVIVPAANAAEVSLLARNRPGLTAAWTPGPPTRSGLVARAADHLLAVCAHLDGTTPLAQLAPPPSDSLRLKSDAALDLSDVRGQLMAKRALMVAAAGGHSILMMGPPGVGKSMLARRLPTLLPPMTEEEALEVAAIASASAQGFAASSFGRRPVRTPHHTASAVALVGGGSRARPGEISLAHHGVLFLDELLEYDRRALEALREPLESGVVCVARAAVQTQYPAAFQLVAAMNPCPCGRLGDPSGGCRCTPADVLRYRGRISAPLLERLDIQIEVPRVESSEFDEPPGTGESSAVAAARVEQAREIQRARQGVCNARLPDAKVDRLCSPDPMGRAILERAVNQLGFSTRTRQRVLKLARTIADLKGEATVSASHVSEALSYRTLDRRPV